MDAQRRTALFFVTQGLGCASCMCDCGIYYGYCVAIKSKIKTTLVYAISNLVPDQSWL